MQDGLTVDRRSGNLIKKMAHARRKVYEDQDARISTWWGCSHRPDTLTQTAPIRLWKSLADGAGHTFFIRHKQGGRFGQCLVLAMKLPLQLLDPPAVLPRFHRAGCPRLAETGDRIPPPAIEFRRIQPLLAAPGAPRRPSIVTVRSPLAAAPLPSSAGCQRRIHWPRHPPANVPTSPR